MTRHDDVIDPLDYEHRLAMVVDTIRYGISGVQSPAGAAAVTGLVCAQATGLCEFPTRSTRFSSRR
jgi:hypothetical protein